MKKVLFSRESILKPNHYG